MSRLLFVLTIVLAIALCSLPGALRAGAPASTGATVRGVVHFEGKVPSGKPINMAADPVCAKQHPSAVMMPEILADAQGDLQNVVVFVSEGLNGQVFNPLSQAAVVEQKGCLYEPHVLAVRASQMLALVNDDATQYSSRAG